MINVNQLRNGVAYEEDGAPLLVIKYEFTKMGRGTGNVKVKVRNLESGSVVTKTYITGNKVQGIKLNKKKLQYLYLDGDKRMFMDPVSFEQIEIENSLIEEQAKYLVDGMEVDVLYWDPPSRKASEGQELKPLSVELPVKMVFKVTETDPGEKGNSAAKVTKPAVLSNGLKVRVPLFMNIGDKIRVDTRTGEYVERA